MLRKSGLFILLIVVASLSATAKVYYVATTGSNANPGSLQAPFKTINYALGKANKAGDTVLVRAGTYRETATFPFSGSPSSPITLMAYNKEKVVISGTDVFDTLKWLPSTLGTGIFQAKYSGSFFEQLYFKGKPVIQARWPNLPKDAQGDWNFWDSAMWASTDKGSSYGTIVDAALVATGLDVTGALAVLNVNHQYYCWSRNVIGHQKGSSTFAYPQDLGTSINTSSPYDDDKYYLTGLLSFLDSPGEWFHDTLNDMLYFYPPDGQNPNVSGGIEIKTRNYGVKASGKKYLNLQDLTFWATAFQFNSLNSGCDGLVFSNNTVLNSSWTEYYRVDTGYAANFEDILPTIYGNNCKILGNTFAFGALSALFVNGLDNLIENNIFHDFNYNSSLQTPALSVNRTWDAIIGKAGRCTVRYNDIYNGGGVLLQTGQDSNDVCYNHVYQGFLSCYGGNKDHSLIYTNCQTNSSATIGTRFHHNWVYQGYSGTVKNYWGGGIAIRGDDNTAGITVDHNVSWNLGSVGIQIKSPDTPTLAQANRAINNTSFNNSALNTIKSSVIMESQVNLQNRYSSLYNNIGKGFYGSWNAAGFKFLTQRGNNYDNLVLPLTDFADYDFRPVAGAAILNKGKKIAGITDDATDGLPDQGAYERGISTYFVPGRRDSVASFPIVPDGKVNVPVTKDQLMWRPAYDAAYNKVYFGKSATSLTFQKNTPQEQNVFPLTGLLAGTTYYWRVDAVKTDSSVATGNVWSFTTAGVLPIVWTDLSATPTDRANRLAWTAYSLGNVVGYEVQRLSMSGIFETIGFVSSSDLSKSYVFLDSNFFRTSTYRLLMLRNDGTECFSNQATVVNPGDPLVKILSAPSYINIKIDFGGRPDQNATIVLYDITGKTVFTVASKQENNYIRPGMLPKGSYVAQVRYKELRFCQVITLR